MIELSNVWKNYGATDVLRGVNLTVKEGEFISIRGKSALERQPCLKLWVLLEPPDKGKVRVFGGTVNGLSDNEKSELRLHHIGFVFQFFNLIPSLTVLKNVELPLALAGMKKQRRRQRARELLEYFDLRARVWHLSRIFFKQQHNRKQHNKQLGWHLSRLFFLQQRFWKQHSKQRVWHLSLSLF